MTDGVERLLGELGATGRLDSSGVFRVDLVRAHQLLPKFALASPEEYILRLLAAAVEARASRFSLSLEAGALCLSWDGAPLEEEDLVRQLPGPSQGELGLGLWAARQRFRRLELLGRTHRLRLDSKELAIEPLDEPHPETNVFLHGPWWKGALGRWLPGKEERLLQQRCRLAPLRLELRGNHLPVKLDFGERDILIKVGEPPFECDHDLAIPVALGSGYLALGGDVAPDVGSSQLFGLASQTPTWAGEARPQGGRVLVIRSGVSYEPDWQPSLPMARVLWWSDELPLDLSRSGLVEGAALERWTGQLEAWFEKALVEHLLGAPYPAGSPYLEWVLEKCRSHPESDLVGLPLFANSDGQRLSIEQLQAEYLRRGYLAVSPAKSKHAAPGVLWTAAAPGPELRAHFSHRIRVDSPPRRSLSNQRYVLKVPLPLGVGEMGLRADCLPWLRLFSADGEVTHQHGSPFLDVTSEELPLEPGDLFYCLLSSTALSPELRLFHSLNFLCWLVHAAGLKGQRELLLRLLEALPRLSVSISNGSMDPEELSDFIHSITIPIHGGAPANLVQMARNGGVWFWSNNDEVEHGVHLRLSASPASLLARLLAPRTQLSEAHYSRASTRALKGARNPAQLLQRLCGDPECAAYKMLRPQDRARFATVSIDAPSSLCSLIVEARKVDAMVQTPALLEALRPRLELLQAVELLPPGPPGAARLRHEDFDALEPRPDTDDPLGIHWYHSTQAWFLMKQGRFYEARGQAELALEASPAAEAFGTLAAATALGGNVLGSLPLYERALDLAPETPHLWRNYAEDLALVGRTEEAGHAVEKALSLNPKYVDALGIKASLLLESQPEKSWKLCEQLIREAEFPVSVWETRALAAERLGRLDDARQSWRKFLEGAWVETLLENNLPERRARAEERLARLATA